MDQSLNRKILLASLALALAALPYSSKVCQAGLIVFLINWLLEGRWVEKKMLLEQNPLVWLLPAFFFLHFIGLWYTDNLQLGWANLDKKFFLLAVPIALASTRPFDKWELNSLFGAFMASLLVGTFICIGHAASLYALSKPLPGLPAGAMQSYLQEGAESFWLYFSNTSLASGIRLHPTYFALYLALCLLLLIYVYRDNADDLIRKERIVLYGIFSYFALFIVFLSSKMITLAAIVIVIFAATRFITKASKPFSIFVVSTVTMAIISFAFINPVSRITGIQELLVTEIPIRDTKNPDALPRLSFWKAAGGPALRQINPVFGAGTGDVNDLLGSVMAQPHPVSKAGILDPHNQFLNTWLALGLVGVLTLLIVFVVPMYFAFRRKYFLTSAFISLFLLVCLTESALEAQKGIIFFALFNSLFLFQQKGLQHTPPDEVIFA